MEKFRWQEVVRVESPIFLVSSNHHACRYETHDGKPLRLGYYLALGPSRANRASYGSDLWYLGPFVTHDEAHVLQISALALGIVELDIAEPVLSIPAKYDQWQRSFAHAFPA